MRGCDDVFYLRDDAAFQRPAVGDRAMHSSQAVNGRVQVVERRAFRDARRHLCSETPLRRGLVDHQQATGLLDRPFDGLDVQRRKGAGVDHLKLSVAT